MFSAQWLLLLLFVEMEHRHILWMLMEALHFTCLLEVKTTSNLCLFRHQIYSIKKKHKCMLEVDNLQRQIYTLYN